MKITTYMRRSRAVGATVLLLALVATGCASPAASEPSSAGTPQLEGEVIWADYGGPTNEARQAIYFDSFYDETGVDVVSVPIEDAIFSSMLRGEPGDYDIFQAAPEHVIPALENLLEVPQEARGELLPEQLRPYYIGGFVFGAAQGWLTATFPDGGPQNWADFFDVEEFPGKRAWPGAPGSYDASYEIALLADGVPYDELYPLDIERAEAKLDTIRPELIFYQSYPEVQQLLVSGSVAIAVTVTGQYTALANAGEDVTVQWNEAFAVPTGFVAVADVDNPEEVGALATWINDPERQAAFTEKTGYGPANPEVFDYLPEEIANNVVNSPSHTNVLDWDLTWRAENRDKLLDAYTAWLAG